MAARKINRSPGGRAAGGGIAKAVWTLEERVNNLIDDAEKERERAQEQNRALSQAIEALSTAVRTLTTEVAELKRLIADHDRTNEQVEGIDRRLATLERDFPEVKSIAEDVNEKLIEARGVRRVWPLVKNGLWAAAVVGSALVSWWANHRSSLAP